MLTEPTRRLWAAIAQICNDGRANVRRDRHPCALSAFGTKEHLAGTPVDIIEGECRDLAGPQAELGEHHQNGVVPPSHRSCSVATIECLLHLGGGQKSRQARELPSSHRRHAIGQRARVQPLMVEVTEEGSQRPAHCLPCSRAPILGVALDVADHLLLTDLA